MKYTLPPDQNSISATQLAYAIAIRQDRYGRAKALRQVQHWTDNRLIKPSGQIRTGTGTGRAYSRTPTLAIAAILQDLVLLGFTISQLRPIARFLYGDGQVGVSAVPATPPVLSPKGQLFIGFDTDAKGQRKLAKLSIHLRTDKVERDALQDRCRSSMLVNLAPILMAIRWPT